MKQKGIIFGYLAIGCLAVGASLAGFTSEWLSLQKPLAFPWLFALKPSREQIRNDQIQTLADTKRIRNALLDYALNTIHYPPTASAKYAIAPYLKEDSETVYLPRGSFPGKENPVVFLTDEKPCMVDMLPLPHSKVIIAYKRGPEGRAVIYADGLYGWEPDPGKAFPDIKNEDIP